ncbi:transaldolase [Spirosoma utsteinense]|uniref:Transaldolase n=1 Tax=Spirosoma utsteinense TaxID=2585773 RepID=A0ABR6WDF2_9BACT|nr:transaldolase [Spirosoma utsteinense]MBC3787428.1 transaldolase/transaldolase/glucose-6-phosphate isomerase [Spirosoma utsteinense]MBC3794552.1 transaldolase/transaldolase/glucose-6-phosphate isomerase [Spirosoma utsteinense]
MAAENLVKKIHDFEQSIWLDFIDRKIMDTGDMQKLIDVDGVRGLTSNPAIFEKAISSGTDYDEDIKKLALEGKSNEDIFYGVAVADIQRAADLFLSVYDEEVRGADGYVSLEVSPFLARDTQGTIEQARVLWKAVDRRNVMIKIPGTAEGLAAIRQCISEGMNINVTLLFGLARYEAVAEAYISGLEDRVKAGHPIDSIASVASFFLSRIDVLVDPMLDEKGLGDQKGEVAIALAKQSYAIYKTVFGSDRFKKLEEQGAKPQRLLWASTSSKNPAFSDVKYVEALIGPKTVNTVPMETLEAFRDHGQPDSRLESNMEGVNQLLDKLAEVGIDLDAVSQQLEDEGIEKFNKPYEKLLEAIDKQKEKSLASA